jgi:hypothetical protein
VRLTCIGLESANAPSTRRGTVSIIGHGFTGHLYPSSDRTVSRSCGCSGRSNLPRDTRESGHPQKSALCFVRAGHVVIYNEITYAKCDRLQGDSISLPQRFPFPPRPGVTPGNISTMNNGQPKLGGYIVSTFSPPAGATSSNGNLAVYTCEGGSYSQCDGGLCFTSTSSNGQGGGQIKSSPLWGNVSNSQIICSCPVWTTSIPFEVMGPKPCPTTAAGYDAVCGANVSKGNNGAITYIGTPVGFELAAACLVGHPVTFNHCTRPEQ